MCLPLLADSALCRRQVAWSTSPHPVWRNQMEPEFPGATAATRQAVAEPGAPVQAIGSVVEGRKGPKAVLPAPRPAPERPA